MEYCELSNTFFLNQNLFFRFLEVHIKPTPTYNVASMPLPI